MILRGPQIRHQRRPATSRSRVLLIAIAICVSIVSSGPTNAADEAAPLGRWDFSPYSVVVSVTFTPDPRVTPPFREQVILQLATRIRQTFGAAWKLVPPPGSVSDRGNGVRDDDWLAPPDETGLARLTSASVAEHLRDAACDKAYLLTVSPAGPAWIVAGREWNVPLQSIGSLRSSRTLDRREVADAAGGLLRQLFSPLLIVDDADRQAKTASVTVRAGSLPFGDLSFVPLKPGALFLPVFRFLDSKRALKKIQPVPWSYLVLDEIDHGHGKCSVVSSYQAPLAANMRRRVEALAVLIRPELPGSELALVTGRPARQPLAGAYVSLEAWPVDKSPAKVKGVAPPPPNNGSTSKEAPTKSAAATTRPPRLMSDRRGLVMIPVDPAHPLRQIEVQSGSAILARRPFVPGVDAEVTLELPDDTLRLGAEREIDLLRGRLIESVARRAAAIGRTRAAAHKNDAPAAQQLLGELQRLPKADDYLAQLNQIRVLALEDTHRVKDRIAERRIEDLCQRTRQLIEQFLPDDRIHTIQEEVADVLKETNRVATLKPPGPPAARPPSKRSSAARGKAAKSVKVRAAETEETAEPASETPEATPKKKPRALPPPRSGGGL